MHTRIALTEDQFNELANALDHGDETAGVVATSLMEAAATEAPAVTLLARDITWVPEDAYLERTQMGLSISSTGWVPAFRTAIKTGSIPVFIHTHPHGRAMFSEYDDIVDQNLAYAARNFGALYYASIVIAGAADNTTVTARIAELTGETPIAFHPVDAVRVVGAGIQLLLPPVDDDAPVEDDAFDRQIRMLGEDGQRTLRTLRVAVIGAGGTGSAVAVQVTRLGIGHIALVDDDIVTKPTPTRGHGMRTSDIGRPKVEVLGRHLRDIGLPTAIQEINAPLHAAVAIDAITHADVVFSCVDGHGARLILNRWAYAHMAPVIDTAVLVTPVDGSDGRRRVEIDQRITWLGPGCACLLCRGRLNPALAAAENLDPETRKRLAGEGYVAEAETPEPAVVTLTTGVAAYAATELLMRLTGLGPTDATETLIRPHLGDNRRNRVPQRAGCFCTDPAFTGRGRRTPYLDLIGAWT